MVHIRKKEVLIDGVEVSILHIVDRLAYVFEFKGEKYGEYCLLDNKDRISDE